MLRACPVLWLGSAEMSDWVARYVCTALYHPFKAGGSICSLDGIFLPIGEKSAVSGARSKEPERSILSLYLQIEMAGISF